MNFGLFISVFDQFADPAIVKRLANNAEDFGFGGIFLPDHLHYGNKLDGALDPWMMLSSIAATTKNIKLGTWVTAVPRRLPWQLARNVATLDQISNGRTILGAGLGSPAEDYTDYGIDYNLKELAEKFDEALDIINGLWQQENFSYEGKHYTIDGVNLHPKPVQKPRVPIIIAGRWPSKKPIQRGAKWDGIMPISSNFPKPLTNDEITEMISYYKSQGGNGDIFISNYAEVEELDANISFCKQQEVSWIIIPVVPSLGTLEENIDRIKEISTVIKDQ